MNIIIICPPPALTMAWRAIALPDRLVRRGVVVADTFGRINNIDPHTQHEISQKFRVGAQIWWNYMQVSNPAQDHIKVHLDSQFKSLKSV